MTSIPIGEFKDNASKFIAAAEAGEEIVLTRHGKATVRLVAASEAAQRARARAATEGLLKHRAEMLAEGRTTTMDEIVAWRDEGRK